MKDCWEAATSRQKQMFKFNPEWRTAPNKQDYFKGKHNIDLKNKDDED